MILVKPGFHKVATCRYLSLPVVELLGFHKVAGCRYMSLLITAKFGATVKNGFYP